MTHFKFIKLLHHSVHPKDEKGLELPPLCFLYAYCLMPNHIHLLIKESQEGIGSVIKRIAISYASYFNHKYQRIGHLFQDRFKSEPVDDMNYFITLIRYIHQNPVAAGITSNVEDYVWSSWVEYTESRPCLFPVCTSETSSNVSQNRHHGTGQHTTCQDGSHARCGYAQYSDRHERRRNQ